MSPFSAQPGAQRSCWRRGPSANTVCRTSVTPMGTLLGSCKGYPSKGHPSKGHPSPLPSHSSRRGALQLAFHHCNKLLPSPRGRRCGRGHGFTPRLCTPRPQAQASCPASTPETEPKQQSWWQMTAALRVVFSLLIVSRGKQQRYIQLLPQKASATPIRHRFRKLAPSRQGLFKRQAGRQERDLCAEDTHTAQ